MEGWKGILKADPTDWLLEEDNPTVRYLTLRDILSLPETDTDVRQARAAIMERGTVPQILAKQCNGCWETPEEFYHIKYRATIWQLIILAELHAAPEDSRIKAACSYVLENAQDRQSYGFSTRLRKRGGGLPSLVVPCLTGNMVWALTRLGCLQDDRVQKAIAWIVAHQRFDDGTDFPPRGGLYDTLEMCWGRHTCHMGVVKALKALAEIPADQRSSEVARTIEEGAEYILKHHIYKRSHDLTKISKPTWLKLEFPLMYQTDILEILGILIRLGYRDQRMYDAMDIVISKQDDRGRWKLERSFNGKFQVDIETKGQPSKGITLNALRAIKGFVSS